MKTNFLASVLALIFVTLATLIHQWLLTTSTGNLDRERTNLERLLGMKPCFLRGIAQPRLGEVCLKQADEAIAQGDFQNATEPLHHLLRRVKDNEPPTGYEEEAERRLNRLPQQHLDYAKKMMEQGKVTEARKLLTQIGTLYPPSDLRDEAKALVAQCSLREIVNLINQGQFEEAMDALKDLLASTAPASVKDQAYTNLVPVATEGAVRRRLNVRQIKRAFEVIQNARDVVKDRPDLVARMDDLRDWVGRQLFNEPIGKDSAPLPAPIWAGPPEVPDSATMWVRNSTPYPLRVVISAGVGDTLRRSLSLKPGETGRLVLPPGDYWQKASCPSTTSVRPYFGDLMLGVGTYRQTFVVFNL